MSVDRHRHGRRHVTQRLEINASSHSSFSAEIRFQVLSMIHLLMRGNEGLRYRLAKLATTNSRDWMPYIAVTGVRTLPYRRMRLHAGGAFAGMQQFWLGGGSQQLFTTTVREESQVTPQGRYW